LLVGDACAATVVVTSNSGNSNGSRSRALSASVARRSSRSSPVSLEAASRLAGLMDGSITRSRRTSAFLLATPVIFSRHTEAPDLMGPLGDGVATRRWSGSLCAMVTALISVKFSPSGSPRRPLIPFGSTVWSPDCSASFDSPSQKVRDGRVDGATEVRSSANSKSPPRQSLAG